MIIFTTLCYAEHGIAMASCLSIRPSRCPSVELLWSYSLGKFEYSCIVRLGSLFSSAPNISNLVQGGHNSKFQVEYMWGMKSGC